MSFRRKCEKKKYWSIASDFCNVFPYSDINDFNFLILKDKSNYVKNYDYNKKLDRWIKSYKKQIYDHYVSLALIFYYNLRYVEL